MGDFVSFFVAVLSDWQLQSPANQVAIAVTVLLPLVGWIWSSTRVTSYKRERDGAKSEAARLEAERRSLLASVAEAKAAEALYNPHNMLDRASRERQEGNDERAVQALQIGFDNIAPGLADISRQLADHTLSIMAERDTESALGLAGRYAHIAVLLEPRDRETQRVLEEIVFAQADFGEAIGSSDLWNTSLPSDPKDADKLISVIQAHGNTLVQKGLYRLAVRLFSRGLLAAKRAGVYDQPAGFAARYHEAQARGMGGDISDALKKVQILLPVQERVQGTEHPNVLSTRILEVRLLADIGDTSCALEKVHSLLSLEERLQGRDHPSVLTTRYLEAQILSDTGDASGALEKVQALLPIITRVRGAKHPVVFTTRDLEAQLLSDLGHASAALEKVLALLDVQQQVLNTDHPTVLRTRWLKAKIEAGLGKTQAALNDLKIILLLQEEKMLPTHRHVRDTRELINKLSAL
ncbi:hypothetical protein [Henriciella marina]|uniref:hypothetical protein n=1 Tax=Henriciella marina TaxID=453851 RepID=UPI0003764E2C|nr:hypothetical protein [Henriciella marina]